MSESTNGVTNTSTSTTDPAGAVIAANDYSPTKISNATERGTTEKQRAQKIIDFFLNKGLPIEVGIGVAGVWSAESNIKTWVYNKNEHSDGYAFRDKHAPNADKFTYKGQTYYKDQANMMKFGYGKVLHNGPGPGTLSLGIGLIMRLVRRTSKTLRFPGWTSGEQI